MGSIAYNQFLRRSRLLQESLRKPVQKKKKIKKTPRVSASRATITTNQSADCHVPLREREENLCGLDARKSARQGVGSATKSVPHAGRKENGTWDVFENASWKGREKERERPNPKAVVPYWKRLLKWFHKWSGSHRPRTEFVLFPEIHRDRSTSAVSPFV